ncbi:MAG: hypothetical protein KJ956_14505 [Actinobacteria bacterium]|nr:hypothetical protein [Actinomycetota bacterium]
MTSQPNTAAPRLENPTRELEASSHLEAMAELNDIVYGDRALEVASALVRSGAYKLDLTLPRDEWYTWKSGIRAPCYNNCRTLLEHPSARRAVEDAMSAGAREMFGSVDVVIGIAHAGIPWAAVLARTLDVPNYYLRAEAKAHGIGGRINPQLSGNGHALIVDDLVAGGESVRDAVAAIREESDIEPAGILSIVNWGFSSMQQNLVGERVRALTSYPWILAVALSEGLVDLAGYSKLMAFYKNPRKYDWSD